MALPRKDGVAVSAPPPTGHHQSGWRRASAIKWRPSLPTGPNHPAAEGIPSSTANTGPDHPRSGKPADQRGPRPPPLRRGQHRPRPPPLSKNTGDSARQYRTYSPGKAHTWTLATAPGTGHKHIRHGDPWPGTNFDPINIQDHIAQKSEKNISFLERYFLLKFNGFSVIKAE